MAPRKGWKKPDVACAFEPESFSLPGEEWLPVVGWDRVYRVSNLGRVYSLHQTGRFVNGMAVRDGYHIVKVRDRERRAHMLIHCMVLEAFVGPRPLGHEACHGPAGAASDALSNLRWDTKQANQADRLRDGTSLRGRRISQLTADQVRQIRADTELTAKDWALKLGVTQNSVFSARSRRTWSEIE